MHASIGGDRDETDELREEAALASDLGFDFVRDVPIVARPGIRVRNQGKFHPRAYLAGLSRLVHGDGCAIHEHTQVDKIEDDPLAVVSGNRRITCDHVVLATHVPLIGKTSLLKASLLQARLAPYSSYVVSGVLPRGAAPEVSLWDTSDPYYYLRIDAGPKSDRVLFGGNDHKTGQATDANDRFQRLAATLRGILPQARVDHHWSGQVIATNDGLPLIGEMAPRQFVATGYNGNGITFATLAAWMARDWLLQKSNPWQELFSVDRSAIRSCAADRRSAFRFRPKGRVRPSAIPLAVFSRKCRVVSKRRK